jgi:hypothetical protein
VGRRIAVVLLVAAVACSSGSAIARGRGTFPQKLTGKWTRTVTTADTAREKTNGVTAGSSWTLIVQKDGSSIVGGNGGQFSGKLVVAGPTSVHVRMGDPSPNVYAWRVAGNHLTLTRIKDADGDRAAIFWGTWQREN